MFYYPVTASTLVRDHLPKPRLLVHLCTWVLDVNDFAVVCSWSASNVRRRFFPALQYLSTSKIAIAVAGNFAFAMALCVYQATVKASIP